MVGFVLGEITGKGHGFLAHVRRLATPSKSFKWRQPSNRRQIIKIKSGVSVQMLLKGKGTTTSLYKPGSDYGWQIFIWEQAKSLKIKCLLSAG